MVFLTFSAWLLAHLMRRKAFRMVQKHLLIARKTAFTAKPTERSRDLRVHDRSQTPIVLEKDTDRFRKTGREAEGFQHPLLANVWMVLSEVASVEL